MLLWWSILISAYIMYETTTPKVYRLYICVKKLYVNVSCESDPVLFTKSMFAAIM